MGADIYIPKIPHNLRGHETYLPTGYRFVQNFEHLCDGDRYAHITADGVTWHPIRAEIVGDLYDDEWHPRYVIRADVMLPSMAEAARMRACHHARLAIYYETGELPLDPRNQDLIDRWIYAIFKCNLRRDKTQRRRAA